VLLPPFIETGDLPYGIHRATLRETIEHFGTGTPKRRVNALRLERIYRLAAATGQLRRFVVFGSFVTTKSEPNDIDVFMLMEDTFDAEQLTGESRLLFDHITAQTYFGCSLFWVRHLAALHGEEAAIKQWQIKRDGTERGIVEIIQESP
jgi:hypothetical protein